MNYKVLPIKRNDYKMWLLHKHYAHRIPLISYAFGLYDSKNVLQGVCTFGSTPSIQLNYSVSLNKFDVVELNRLCINDNLDKNCLSFFVGKSLSLLPKPLVVVSFADKAHSHTGYIYQATNWIYTGLNAKRNEWKSKSNPKLHYRGIAEKYKGIDKKQIEDLEWIPLSRKHRYIYFLGNKKQKKEMLKNLRYEILPYPKGDNKRYDASYKPKTQELLF